MKRKPTAAVRDAMAFIEKAQAIKQSRAFHAHGVAVATAAEAVDTAPNTARSLEATLDAVGGDTA